jgi:hypothetical protein
LPRDNQILPTSRSHENVPSKQANTSLSRIKMRLY